MNQLIIDFYGRASGYNATIWCGYGHNCTVICHQDACNNLQLYCLDGDDETCTYYIDCYYAQQSINCPDGYPNIDDLNLQLPNILDTVMSTYDNSVISCNSSNSSLTNAINCGDYQECQEDIITNQENKGPICCTAGQFCMNASYLSTRIDLNSSDINGVAIRCDGDDSCNAVNNVTFAVNGGDIYFSGNNAGNQVSRVVGQYGKTDIFCNSFFSNWPLF